MNPPLSVNYGTGGVLATDRPPAVRTAPIDTTGVAAMQEDQRQRVTTEFRNTVSSTYWSRFAAGAVVGTVVSVAAPLVLNAVLGAMGLVMAPWLAPVLLVAGAVLMAYQAYNAVQRYNKLQEEMNKDNVRMSKVLEEAGSAGFEGGFTAASCVFMIGGGIKAGVQSMSKIGTRSMNKTVTGLVDEAAEGAVAATADDATAAAGSRLKVATEVADDLARMEARELGRVRGMAGRRVGGPVDKATGQTLDDAVEGVATRKLPGNIEASRNLKTAQTRLTEVQQQTRTVQEAVDQVKTAAAGSADATKTVKIKVGDVEKEITVTKLVSGTGPKAKVHLEVKTTTTTGGTTPTTATKTVRLEVKGDKVKGWRGDNATGLHQMEEQAKGAVATAQKAVKPPTREAVWSETRAALKEEMKFLDRPTLKKIAGTTEADDIAALLGREPGTFTAAEARQIRVLARETRWFHQYETKGLLMKSTGQSGFWQEASLGSAVSTTTQKAVPFVSSIFTVSSDVQQAMAAQEQALMVSQQQRARDASPPQQQWSGFGANPNGQNFTVI